jgi:hypothetical protein
LASKRPPPSRAAFSLKTREARTDGAGPTAGLIAKFGKVYGATRSIQDRFAYDGSVFKLARSGGGFAESVLYRFQGESDGTGVGSELLAGDGSLFGVAFDGGSSACQTGCGTVFALK